MQTLSFDIQHQLNTLQSQQALELYAQAICLELHGMDLEPEKVQRLLQTVVDWRYGVYALSAGEVVGIAGFQQPSGSFTGAGNWRSILKALGYKAFWRLMRSPLNHGPQHFADSEMWHNGLYVAPAHRRQGIAKALLQRIADVAKYQGYQQLTLRVAHDNNTAKTLYQTLGYQPQQATSAYQCLTKIVLN
ncbi:GNAT family N-acetyltransferase [Marinomonas communis]|jgi:ribosomal protein S18 acetylase RimI-like enzyme|uniref:Acetyltransferase (GNAT) family protein n=1 Tax=Marinomonas communis TaxID=28254 RepID=A0A4R6WYB1_9GAMM|nr:GNAT family N-acetyltransferase [Marinomonas communis]TDR06204.1 acetyltransferase (GNAT) family protein [Marinomonas communis]